MAKLVMPQTHSYLGCLPVFAAFYQETLSSLCPPTFLLVWFLKTPDDAITFLKEVILSLLARCGQQDLVPTQSVSAVQEKTDDTLSSSLTLNEPHTLHSEHSANSSTAMMIWPPHHS